MSSHPQSSGRDVLLSFLKSFAKKSKKAQPGQKLASYQDKVANLLGYGNWSLLHKHLYQMPNGQFGLFLKQVQAHPQLGLIFNNGKTATAEADPDVVMQEMRNWVKTKYTPLNDFAFYDKESENGFAWPSVELIEELQDEFGDQYPFELIEKVAHRLEEYGPWGIEEYGEKD